MTPFHSCRNVTPSPLIEQLLNQSPKKKKPKRHPIHQNKNEEELIFTGEEVVDEELSQVLDDIYAKAGESCKLIVFLRPLCCAALVNCCYCISFLCPYSFSSTLAFISYGLLVLLCHAYTICFNSFH